MLLYYMPASNGRHILPLSSLTLIPIPRSSLSSRAGTMTESNHSFLPRPAQRRNGSCQNILSEVLGLGLRSGWLGLRSSWEEDINKYRDTW